MKYTIMLQNLRFLRLTQLFKNFMLQCDMGLEIDAFMIIILSWPGEKKEVHPKLCSKFRLCK